MPGHQPRHLNPKTHLPLLPLNIQPIPQAHKGRQQGLVRQARPAALRLTRVDFNHTPAGDGGVVGIVAAENEPAVAVVDDMVAHGGDALPDGLFEGGRVDGVAQEEYEFEVDVGFGDGVVEDADVGGED